MDISSFLGGNFLTHLDLVQPYQIWTIGKVDQQMVGQGANAEPKICLTFNEFPSKPLAANKTNLKRLAALYSTDANAWIGRQLLVNRSITTFGNETKLCARVCGPQQAPPDSICDPQGNAVLYQAPATQPAVAPAPQTAQPAPQQPVAAPQTAPAQAVATQPTADPQQAIPWEQNESSPPSA